MDSKEIYIKQFQDILATEIRFVSQYKSLIDLLHDADLTNELRVIYKDEQRHVDIAKDLVRMVSE